MQWPKPILELLRAQTDSYMDQHAAKLAKAGEGTFAEVLSHMRTYQKEQASFADFGDINQGQASLPTHR